MSGVPFRLTAPTALPVSLLEAKANSRTTDTVEDELFEAKIAAAVAYLDGWSGILGRCIMPQTWAQVWTDGETEVLLAMPDATVTAVKIDGAATTAYSTELTARGLVLTLDGVSGSELRVEYSCAMGSADLAVAKTLIVMMVSDMHVNREGGGWEGRTVEAFLSRLRWGRL